MHCSNAQVNHTPEISGPNLPQSVAVMASAAAVLNTQQFRGDALDPGVVKHTHSARICYMAYMLV